MTMMPYAQRLVPQAWDAVMLHMKSFSEADYVIFWPAHFFSVFGPNGDNGAARRNKKKKHMESCNLNNTTAIIREHSTAIHQRKDSRS